MNNTHNITYTTLNTAIHRIVQQQPTNMQQLENIVDSVENQYGVPISLDNVNLTVNEVSLDDLAIDQDTLDECSEILWLCDSAGHPTNNSNTHGIPDDTQASQEAIDWLAGIAYQKCYRPERSRPGQRYYLYLPPPVSDARRHHRPQRIIATPHKQK